MDKTGLGDRMKGYEGVTRTRLVRRMPVMIRVDGKAFHTFTKHSLIVGDSKPFSQIMHDVMSATALALCENIQNVKFAYMQSDEISLYLRDWDSHVTDQWFDGIVQKIVSTSASIATAAFNREWRKYDDSEQPVTKMPMFDSRVWNLPKEEVTNYFVWRQQDWSRNSIQMAGRHYFSHSEMHGQSTSAVQDMLHEQHGVNWNAYEVWEKRGTAFYRDDHGWIKDEHMPILSQDRSAIDKLIYID